LQPSNLHAILAAERRSTRAYLPAPVPDEVLRQLVAAARLAPSGANLQPGSFISI